MVTTPPPVSASAVVSPAEVSEGNNLASPLLGDARISSVEELTQSGVASAVAGEQHIDMPDADSETVLQSAGLTRCQKAGLVASHLATLLLGAGGVFAYAHFKDGYNF